MTLPPRTRLGPYEITAALGAGSMGEVYRARDDRLGRDVAVKVLPATLAGDADRLRRFENEARAAARLNHPNILQIYDVGQHDGQPYLVTELLEGETLRERLARGPLNARRAIEFSIGVAQGLAAAHDEGIVHRDLKPENLFLTKDGRVKILDFGLAKLARPERTDGATIASAPTVGGGTEAGIVMGTVGYMSPEQVRGSKVDARSDTFALGALIYEMVSGLRAFRGESPADTMTAILREDPMDLTQLAPDVPPAIDRIVRRCLEKNPADRFRSVADLAYALEALSSGFGVTAASDPASASTAPGVLTFQRITYRNGYVVSARFTPDGAGVAFSALWEGRPPETFTSFPGSPAARSLGLPESTLLAMSATGELALSLGFRYRYWTQTSGTLARVALAGGGARPLQKDVGHADWSPDGKGLAIIRYIEGRCRLEYPAGRVLFETSEWLSDVRVSPDGRLAAFAYHPIFGDSGGDVCVVDQSGANRVLIRGMTSVSGIAWLPSGDEVWCSGINELERHGVWAVRLDGSRRETHPSPCRVTLHDIARDGRVLMGIGSLRVGMNVSSDDAVREADLAWFDGSVVTDLSADGRQVLLVEAAGAENPHYACYLRDVDGSPAVRLGEGTATRISADGEWVLAILNRPSHGLVMYPTGIGEPRPIAFDGIDHVLWAGFHPDSRHVFAVGSTAGRPKRLYLLPVERGVPRLLWDEEIDLDRIVGLPIAPDGDRLVLRRVSGEYVMYSCKTGAAEAIHGLAPGEFAVRFDESGHSLYLASGTHLRQRVDRLNLKRGEHSTWRALKPPDPTGVMFVGPPVVAANGSRYAYSFFKQMSDLYVVEGLG